MNNMFLLVFAVGWAIAAMIQVFHAFDSSKLEKHRWKKWAGAKESWPMSAIGLVTSGFCFINVALFIAWLAFFGESSFGNRDIGDTSLADSAILLFPAVSCLVSMFCMFAAKSLDKRAFMKTTTHP